MDVDEPVQKTATKLMPKRPKKPYTLCLRKYVTTLSYYNFDKRELIPLVYFI